MSIIVCEKGVSLIELITAIVIFVTVVLSLALLAPRISTNAVSNHVQSVANDLAASKIQELQARPYPLIQTTYQANGPGAWFTQTSPPTAQDTCDCGSAAYALLPSSDAVVVDGNTFRRYWCVDAIQNAAGAWHTYCTPPTDQYKNIHLWVVPGIGISSWTISTEATISRF